MRKPICKFCGKIIRYFGRGQRVIKHYGAYLHERCIEAYKESRKTINWHKNKEQNKPSPVWYIVRAERTMRKRRMKKLLDGGVLLASIEGIANY